MTTKPETEKHTFPPKKKKKKVYNSLEELKELITVKKEEK